MKHNSINSLGSSLCVWKALSTVLLQSDDTEHCSLMFAMQPWTTHCTVSTSLLAPVWFIRTAIKNCAAVSDVLTPDTLQGSSLSKWSPWASSGGVFAKGGIVKFNFHFKSKLHRRENVWVTILIMASSGNSIMLSEWRQVCNFTLNSSNERPKDRIRSERGPRTYHGSIFGSVRRRHLV